jgi:hypothetical protein
VFSFCGTLDQHTLATGRARHLFHYPPALYGAPALHPLLLEVEALHSGLLRDLDLGSVGPHHAAQCAHPHHAQHTQRALHAGTT